MGFNYSHRTDDIISLHVTQLVVLKSFSHLKAFVETHIRLFSVD